MQDNPYDKYKTENIGDTLNSFFNKIGAGVRQAQSNVRGNIDVLKQNINLLRTNPKFAREMPGIVEQKTIEAAKQVYGPSVPIDIATRTGAGFLKAGVKAASVPFTKKPLVEKAGDILSGVGAVTQPVTAITTGAINPLFTGAGKLLTERRLPTKQELLESYSQGFELGTLLGPTSKIAGKLPVVSQLSEILDKGGAIQRIAGAGLKGGTGFGIYGGLQPAENIQKRFKNATEAYATGFALGAGGQAVGELGKVVKRGITTYKNIPNKERGGIQISPTGSEDIGTKVFDWSKYTRSRGEMNTAIKDQLNKVGISPQLVDDLNWKIQKVDATKINPNTAADLTNVIEIKKSMQAGEKLPPILAWKIGDRIQILDGPHRLEAIKNLGARDVTMLVGETKSTTPLLGGQEGFIGFGKRMQKMPDIEVPSQFKKSELAEAEKWLEKGFNPKRLEEIFGKETTDKAIQNVHERLFQESLTQPRAIGFGSQRGFIRFGAKIGGKSNLEDKLVKTFGTTENPQEAAFITQDGLMVKSPEGGTLYGKPHEKMIIEATGLRPDKHGLDVMNKYIKKTGNVRTIVTPNEADVFSSSLPNKQQLETIKNMAEGKNIQWNLNVGKENELSGNGTFEQLLNIVGKVKNIFTGIAPNQQDILRAFREGQISFEEAQALSGGNNFLTRPSFSAIAKQQYTDFEKKGLGLLNEMDEAAKSRDNSRAQKAFTDMVHVVEQDPNSPYKPYLKRFYEINLKTKQLAPSQEPGKQRAFLETVAKSPTTSEEMKAGVEAIEPQKYIPITNKESLAAADLMIKKQGIDKVKDYVYSNAPPNAKKAAAFIKLTDKYQKQGMEDEAIKLVDSYDQQLRDSGRFSQAASIWDRLTPVGMLRWAEKQVTKANEQKGMVDKFGEMIGLGKGKVTMPEEFKKEILVTQAKIQAMPEGIDKTIASQKLLDRIGEYIPPGLSDMFNSYRYSNMLSNPKTQMRNIGENLYNTFISRPWDLATKGTVDWIMSSLTGRERQAYFSDIPLYYKKAWNSIPSAMEAVRAVWKKQIPIERPDLQMIKTRQIPGILTAIPRFMEATDKFNSTLISAGQYAINKVHGMGDAEAMQSATKLAEKYLYRTKLGWNDKDASLATRAMQGLASTMETMRKKVPGSGWFIPFIRTPINKAIEMVERVPILGQAGGKIGEEQIARAINGSILMGIGALAAYKGDTTWAAPKDEKERELFYANGRKAFAIRVNLPNNKEAWIPMWYFGPFAMAFALPTAFKYYSKDSPDALIGDKMKMAENIILNSSRFIVEQSPLQGISGLFRLLEGDVDITLENLLGFTAGQVIPAEGLVRYVNTILDQIYRKPRGFFETIMRDLPGLSQNVPSYKTPTGEESRRELINTILPYDIGIEKPQYEPFLQQRQQELQMNKYWQNLENQLEQGK